MTRGSAGIGGEPTLTDGPVGRLRTATARLDRLRLSRPVQVVLVAGILILSWPFGTQVGQLTHELSWQLGLHRAAEDALRFGHDILFTYGPLGFLAWPTPFIGPTSALAFIVTVAIYAALIGLLLRTSLSLFPAWIAVLVTLAFGRAIGWLEPFEALQVLAFGLGVDVLRRHPIAKPWRIAVIAGLLAGAGLLGKVNVGVFVGAMGFIVVLAVSRPRLRGVLIFGGVTLAAVLGGWLVARQQPSDLVAYVRGVAEIISGYSDAMGVAPANARLIAAAFLVVAAIVAAVAVRASVGWPRDRRLALAVLVILLLFACWKFAFVRSHVASTFVTLGFATLFLMSPIVRRRVVATALIAVSAVFLLIIRPSAPGYPSLRDYPAVVRSATDFLGQARDALVPWGWEPAADRTREELRTAFGVPSSILTELDGHTVSVDPTAAAIAAAHPAWTWRPMPIFQSYSAYTSGLDTLDADLLRSDARPERILRQFQGRRIGGGRTVPYAIDGRNYWFESPEATIERLCRYREIAASGDYQVLADTGTGCGAEMPLATVTAALGDDVDVPVAPSPDDVVLVRVHGIGDGPLARLRAALWRTPDWHVTLDGTTYRLVPGTASDGLVLAVPAAGQGSAPFAFGDPTRSIRIDGPRLPGDGPITYEFLTRRLSAS